MTWDVSETEKVTSACDSQYLRRFTPSYYVKTANSGPTASRECEPQFSPKDSSSIGICWAQPVVTLHMQMTAIPVIPIDMLFHRRCKPAMGVEWGATA